jgi:CRISPR-associated protein Cst2
MTFVSGMLLIDAPASALNNSGEAIPGARTDNTSSVKFIRTANGIYPYVSAQAVRYWLRNTLETDLEVEWRASPIYREEKVAYTDGNPLEYWDDDLLGYMRAPATDSGKQKTRLQDPDYQKMTKMEMTKGKEKDQEKEVTITRASPLRISTLVSIAPVNITTDYGTMTRHEGDPVPYEHQFYRATLHGLLSLDLSTAGKFYYRRRTGFQNLD